MDIQITVTWQELYKLAKCGKHMTRYIKDGDGLLITILRGEQGEEVKLFLDESCIHPTASYDTS